ncbi:methyltransferase domain-containing protein [Actinokineospora sp. NPDC004072]
MRETTLALVACPACHGELAGAEALVCGGCGAVYPVEDGVVRFAAEEARASHVAASFGFEWQTFHDGGFEADTVFGRTIEEDLAQFDTVFDVKDSLAGKVIVDAGCGSGKLTAAIARRHPEATVVAVDLNPAISEVLKAAEALPNLHVVQASVFALPFRPGSVDLLWCNGVIHHTGDTRGAFAGLAGAVRPGGELFVWVYQRKLSPLVLVRDLLRPLGLHSWRHSTVYRLSRLLSLPTLAAVRVLNAIATLPGVRTLVARSTHGRILTRRRHYTELALTWFDVLSPRHRDTYTPAEIKSWFQESGYDVVREYWWPVGITGRRR